MPLAVASQWVEATTPKVPSISGRVVNAAMGVSAGPCRIGAGKAARL